MTLPPVCAVVDCGDTHYALGWCQRHYMRISRTGSPYRTDDDRYDGPPANRFGATRFPSLEAKYDYHIRRSETAGECWGWEGPRTSSGFPLLCYRGKQIPAHRWGFERAYGPVAENMNLRNPSGCHCANPEHYELAALKVPARVPKSIEEKFWLRAERSEGCWGWNGPDRVDGVPLLVFRSTYVSAQRFAWQLRHPGRHLPRNQVVKPTCGTTRCVNPEHLDTVYLGDILKASPKRAAANAARWQEAGR